MARSSDYVAFIRAINVAGHPRIKMDVLLKAFSSAGCRNTRSFFQSGNVLFTVSEREYPAVKSEILKEIKKILYREPQIMFRGLQEIEDIVKENPFARLDNESDPKFY